MDTLVKVDNLVKHFPVHGGLLNRVIAKVHAVNGVTFSIKRGEIVGVVGESGCGKSTLGKTLIRLFEPTAGKIIYDGREITHLAHGYMMPFRKHIQMVFQDPNSSLNPRYSAGAMLREVVRFHQIVPHHETRDYIRELVAKVGLHDDAIEKYPHEFSGGQRQRLSIARALAVRPDFVVADEPVSSLDVSIQAQILNLMLDLKEDFDFTMLFISHDLKVVNYFCDRMLVMYLGYVVEELPCGEIEHIARHPYTQALLGANPASDPTQRHELTVLEGEVPSPYNPPRGCPFVTRCPLVEPRCSQEMPPLLENAPGQRVACWAVNPQRTAAAE